VEKLRKCGPVERKCLLKKFQSEQFILWNGTGITSVQRLANGWTVGGSNSVGDEIFLHLNERKTNLMQLFYIFIVTVGMLYMFRACSPIVRSARKLMMMGEHARNV
jgi:hypothetical protein